MAVAAAVMQPLEPALPRAASYPHLPNAIQQSSEELHGLEQPVSAVENQVASTEPAAGPLGASPSPEDSAGPLEISTGETDKDKNEQTWSGSNTTEAAEQVDKEPALTPAGPTQNVEQDEDARTPRSFTKSISQRFRERSWLPGSRSPSPRNREEIPRSGGSPATTSRLFNAGRRSSTFGGTTVPVIQSSEIGSRSRSSSQSRQRAVLTKKLKRPLSRVPNGSTPQNPASAVSPNNQLLAPLKSFSSERLSMVSTGRAGVELSRQTTLPRLASVEKLRGLKMESKKKDELWSVFRALEGEVEKFHAKSSAVKANVVRASLLPFLRNYRFHPSDRRLRPEDLDRRVKILNLWWMGLLDLLQGRTNQAISPSDRPAIFDGIIGIMERPEWRLPPSQYSALKDISSSGYDSRSASSTSLASDASDFLTDSVNHNVKTIFVQNLLSQMTFVIEKMSERQAPATTVNFCGKTCAYAFFFCPDVADILVRLWSPTIDLLQRVLVESGFERDTDFGILAENIAAKFPPTLKSQAVTSVSSLYKSLKPAVKPPLGTEHADWTGYWTKRWSGRESDLFYVFTKNFHLLLVQFLPEHPAKREWICAPGVVIVQAQLLRNIDATIHRHATPADDHLSGPSGVTFDDVLGDPDSALPALPLTPLANANRLMTENRIIMLLRDMLSERNGHPLPSRRVFAEGFSNALRAATKRTSMFNQNACCTLCDFLDEALLILIRYEQLDSEITCVDWSFWLQVWSKMAESHNTSIEIRLYVLIFSLWQSLTADPTRKRQLCFDLLLRPDFFYNRFNHWCPLVRAYFMRLLCWRVVRYDGDEEMRDLDIYSTVSSRLITIFEHYLALRDAALACNKIPPSTAPSCPIPGRRLIIILTDTVIPRGPSSFMTLDGIGVSHSAAVRKTGRDHQSERPSSNSSSEAEGEQDETAGKKFGFLRTIIGTSRQERRMSRSPSRADDDKGPGAQSSPQPRPPNAPVEHRETTQVDTPDVHSFHRSFRFSIEVLDRRRLNAQPVPPPTPPQMRLFAPRLPQPAQQLLLAHTQPADNASASVSARGTADSRTGPIRPHPPSAAQRAAASYAGRALAEWALVVGENQAFFERRRSEGVPSNAWVETPVLSIEVFRRPG